MSINGISGGGVITGTGSLTTKCLTNWYRFDLGDIQGGLMYNYANKKYDGIFTGTNSDIVSTRFKYGTASFFGAGSSGKVNYLLNDTSVSFSQGITLSTWVYYTVDTDGIVFGISDTNTGNSHNTGNSIVITGYHPNLFLSWYYSASSTYWQYTTNCGIALNNWYNVVLVFNPIDKTVKLYVNGTLYTNQTLSANNYPTFVTKYAGCGSFGFSCISGYYDDFRQYNYSLSAANVTGIYNNTFSF